MTEKMKAIFKLGLQKQAELEKEAADGTLSPNQVADKIEKIASVEELKESDIPVKVAALVFDAAYEGKEKETASLMGYLK